MSSRYATSSGQRLGDGSRVQTIDNIRTSSKPSVKRGMRIKQSASTFGGTINLSGNAAASQGNRINATEDSNIEEVDQAGSQYKAEITGKDKATIYQGETITEGGKVVN